MVIKWRFNVNDVKNNLNIIGYFGGEFGEVFWFRCLVFFYEDIICWDFCEDNSEIKYWFGGIGEKGCGCEV